MYPAPIEEYVCPDRIDGCLAELARHGERAKVIAGGQSLMPLLKLRLAEPEVLVDINRIPELQGLAEEGVDGGRRLRIGAVTRHRVLASHPLVAARYPALADAARLIGDVQVRNRGTSGGSRAHADPAADLPVPLMALGADVVVRSQRGERRVDIGDFLKGPLTTDLAPDELLVAVEVPAPKPMEGAAYTKAAAVYGDFAMVSVAARLVLADGVVAEAALAAGGLLPHARRAPAAETELIGKAPTEERLEAAASRMAEELPCQDDMRASSSYRRELLRCYAYRMLKKALARARGEG